MSSYPRPQLARESFFCLDGMWDFAVTGGEEPSSYPEKILVPYPPESDKSSVCRRIGKKDVMWYKTEFSLPEGFLNDRVILHFGAVDQRAKVYLNGVCLGEHEGGYIPFRFDITDTLEKTNTLVVEAKDALDHAYPWGKQKHRNGGMWYTPFSGIWQTVWLESVPQNYITDIKITPNLSSVEIEVLSNCSEEAVISVNTESGVFTHETHGKKAVISVPNPINWTPEQPYLYKMSISMGKDTVYSYFALRTVDIKEVGGIPRICLNGKPYFFHGLLDQGYWKKGICLPEDPDGYAKDIVFAKEMGFNTLRKHIRIEPLNFYYECDRIGMIVFQDFVNNGSYSFVRDTLLPTAGLKKIPDKYLNRNKRSREIFEKTAEQTLKHLYNCPCIVYYTVFNEGWGQFDADKMYTLVKNADSTRVIDTTSGWFTRKLSDVVSEHVYFRPFKFKSAVRPVVLSEFGGYACSADGKQYGYRFFKTVEDYRAALKKLYEDEIIPSVKKGLCAAIYTQISDVEEEQNGLTDYSRACIKASKKDMLKIAQKLKIQ